MKTPANASPGVMAHPSFTTSHAAQPAPPRDLFTCLEEAIIGELESAGGLVKALRGSIPRGVKEEKTKKSKERKERMHRFTSSPKPRQQADG